MRQELSFQKQGCVDDSLLLDVVLGQTSLGDVVESIFLGLYDLGLLQTGSESLFHILVVWAVKAYPVENHLVIHTVESSEQDHQRNAFSDERDAAVDS